MGDAVLIDLMVATLTDPFGARHMGITTENLAEKWKLTREAQDVFAVESHRRAAEAIDAGRFKEQIIPIVKSSRTGDITIDKNEHIRRGTMIADLAKRAQHSRKMPLSQQVTHRVSMMVQPSSFWPIGNKPKKMVINQWRDLSAMHWRVFPITS